MFNIQEQREQIKSRYVLNLELLEKTSGIEDLVSFIQWPHVYLNSNNFNKYKKTLQRLREKYGRYILERYYISATGVSLALNYDFPESNIKFVLYCNEPERALDAVGKGKCSISSKSIIEKTIVCDL